MVHAGAVGVVAQDRHLVEEDLSPHLEIVVVQEEVQERAIAGREAFVDDYVQCEFRLRFKTGTYTQVSMQRARRSVCTLVPVGGLALSWTVAESLASRAA
jgi:hypothetical protein